jgi:ferritin-like metal-binding protein YciE
MAEQTSTRDAKLIQYLNEAYGKEKELETALQAHIKMANERASYKKRLQDHLKETKAQAKGLERRIKQLGGKAEALNLPGPDVASGVASKATAAATKAVAAAKGPVHALRGSGAAEKLLKNVKTELWNEYEEIGNYVAIESLAQAVGDTDTAKLAREFRKQEERMAAFLTKLLPQLGKAVATEEIPASERRTNGRRRTTSRSASSRSKSSRSKASRSKPAKSRSTASRSKASSTRSKASSTRSTSSRTKPAKSRSTASRSKTSSTRTKSAGTRTSS